MNGAGLIAAERQRQIDGEGYTADHDADHAEELAQAGASYALADYRTTGFVKAGASPRTWPWSNEAWKPTPNDRIRELVKAGALIAAAIDSLSGAVSGEGPEPPLRTPSPDKVLCGWCGDWLRLQDIEGHLNSEGRTLAAAPPSSDATYDGGHDADTSRGRVPNQGGGTLRAPVQPGGAARGSVGTASGRDRGGVPRGSEPASPAAGTPLGAPSSDAEPTATKRDFPFAMAVPNTIIDLGASSDAGSPIDLAALTEALRALDAADEPKEWGIAASHLIGAARYVVLDAARLARLAADEGPAAPEDE